jgi:hypothetical protein
MVSTEEENGTRVDWVTDVVNYTRKSVLCEVRVKYALMYENVVRQDVQRKVIDPGKTETVGNTIHLPGAYVGSVLWHQTMCNTIKYYDADRIVFGPNLVDVQLKDIGNDQRELCWKYPLCVTQHLMKAYADGVEAVYDQGSKKKYDFTCSFYDKDYNQLAQDKKLVMVVLGELQEVSGKIVVSRETAMKIKEFGVDVFPVGEGDKDEKVASR